MYNEYTAHCVPVSFDAFVLYTINRSPKWQIGVTNQRPVMISLADSTECTFPLQLNELISVVALDAISIVIARGSRLKGILHCMHCTHSLINLIAFSAWGT